MAFKPPPPCDRIVILVAGPTIERLFYWGERERVPSCGLNGRAVTIDIYRETYVDVRTYRTVPYRAFTATAHARRYAQT